MFHWRSMALIFKLLVKNKPESHKIRVWGIYSTFWSNVFFFFLSLKNISSSVQIALLSVAGPYIWPSGMSYLRPCFTIKPLLTWTWHFIYTLELEVRCPLSTLPLPCQTPIKRIYCHRGAFNGPHSQINSSKCLGSKLIKRHMVVSAL